MAGGTTPIKTARRILGTIDGKDADRTASRREFVKEYRFNLGAREARQQFNRLDRNNDAQIGVRELAVTRKNDRAAAKIGGYSL